MSDIQDNGSFNIGLANIAAQNNGPNAVANQANTAAGTALIQQQAQAAAIQNRNAQLQYQLFARGVAHVTDFSGQGGPTLNAPSDSSGVTAASASPTGAPPAGAPDVPPTPEDDIGQSASKQAYIEAMLEHQYNVNPMGTNAEQQAILQANAEAVQAKLSGNAGLAAAAEQKIQMLKDQRDMNVKDRQNAAQVDASSHYDKFAAVESAPDGKAFETLEAIAPNSAALIQRQNKDATPEELDEIARDTTSHVAAFMHRFTNRDTVVGDDGVTYDKQTGMRVDVPIRGVSPDKQAALLEQANKIVTTKNSDGTETTEPQYKKDGYNNPNNWVTDAVAQIRARNGANNIVEAVGNRAIQYGHLQPGAPPAPGGTLYRGPQPGQPQQPGAGQPGAPGAPPPGAPGAAPQQRPQPAPPPGKFGDNNYVIQSLQDKDYRLNTTPVVQGTSQTPAALEESKNIAAARNDLLKKSGEDIGSASQAQMYLKAAQSILDSKGAALGMYGSLVNHLSKVFGPVTGGTDASNYAQIAKFLGNAALQGAKQTYGARMTQKEVDLQLHELSPNVAMPESAIRDLVGEMQRNAQYAIAAGSQAKKYLAAGNDPREYEDYLQHYFSRDDFVNGQTPPTRPGQQTSGGQQGSAQRTIVRTGTMNGRKVVQYSDGSTAYAE